MQFVVDAQLPPALARWLTQAGHPSEHVADCGMSSVPDMVIWEYAARMGAVILTKDHDFADIRTLSEADVPRVVWLRIGNSRRATLLHWFIPLLPEILAALEGGARIVEVE